MVILTLQNQTQKPIPFNKKVLLRERKRHTTCRVVNTHSVVLTGYPLPDLAGGVPYLGTPWAGYLPPPGYPPGQGTPPPGYPPPPRLDLAGYPPTWTWQGTPLPPGPGRVPPSCPWHSGKCCKALWDMGTPSPPQLPRGILGNVAKHYGIWVPPLWTERLMDGWKDRRVSKHYLPVVLRTRAVIIIITKSAGSI